MPKILVVDDDQLFREYLTALFRRSGFEVWALASGANVGAILDTEAFDAVTIDLYMPGVDGIETLQAVRRSRPALPVIGITSACLGHDDPCVKAMAKFGADAVLCKPVVADELLALLRDKLAQRPSAPPPTA